MLDFMSSEESAVDENLDGSQTCSIHTVWWVNFVIFVVDLAVTKFSHPRKLMPMGYGTMRVHDNGHGQHLPVLASNSIATVIQLIASLTLIFYLRPFVQVSVGMA